MVVEEFSPEPPAPRPNPGAATVAFLLVALAVMGGIGIFWFLRPRADSRTTGPRNGQPALSPQRLPNVVEATDEALAASAQLGLALAVTDTATSQTDGVVRWAGQIVLSNDGPSPVEVEMPDAGNTYVEVETAEGVRVRSRVETRAVQRVPLPPGASVVAQWQDEFEVAVTRIRFVHVETIGEETRVLLTPWIEMPKGGK